MFLFSTSKAQQSGQLLVLVLVFGAIFMIISTSFISSIIAQSRVVEFRFQQQQASDIAEAGLNYYKWYLAHNPGDITGGGVYEYGHPEDGRLGTYELVVGGSSYCGEISSINVTSTGRTDANPDAVAIISATYKQPTVAEYSFITNAGVWFGGGNVVGPVHSNQGLRMEAAHNSLVGSGQATWNCDSTYGCTPDVPNAPGVYSAGSLSTPGLFQFPVSPIDFAGLTLDLVDMKDRAQNNGGIYFGPVSNWGYLVNFNGNSTVTVRPVTGTREYWVFDPRRTPDNNRWHRTERNIITSTGAATTLPIDPSCPILFFEDKVWLQGTINQKVAIAAANLNTSTETNIVINNDVTYVPGSDAGLLAIAENDIDINLVIPGEDLDLHGIYVAQDGRFGRDFYTTPSLQNDLRPFVQLGDFTFLGTQVSNQRAVTNWNGGASGFIGTGGGSSFDRDQIDNPPPLTPTTNDVYELQDWRSEG